MTGNKSTGVRPDTVNHLVANVYPAMAMLAGMQLELFTALRDGPMSVEKAAIALDVQPLKLRPLLYALVTAGLLTMEDGVFGNTEESQTYLVKGGKRYIGGAHEIYSDLWSAALHTAETIRTGKPQCKHDFSAMSDEQLGAFMRGLDPGASAAGRKLAKDYDLSGFKKLLDVGGGSGGLARAITEIYPDLHATVTDLPTVTPITEGFIARHEVGHRISVLAVDTVSQPPHGTYDLAVMRSFLQVLSAEAARSAVINVGKVIEPGGSIYIVGRVLDDSRMSPLDTVAFNMVFLNIYDDGQAYTEHEHRAWLTEGGFEDIKRVDIRGGYSIISARKAV